MVALIGAHGEALVAEGAHATLERWIEQLPAEVRTIGLDVAQLEALHRSESPAQGATATLERPTADAAPIASRTKRFRAPYTRRSARS